jgi:hypothetical protein
VTYVDFAGHINCGGYFISLGKSRVYGGKKPEGRRDELRKFSTKTNNQRKK